MRPIRLTMLCLTLAYPAMGGSVGIAWDATPRADGYRVWQGIRLVKSVRGTTATVTLPDSGVQTIGVTAYNASGESPMAEIKLVPVVVQSSNDLKLWNRLTTIYVEQSPRMFFRLTPPKITTP